MSTLKVLIQDEAKRKRKPTFNPTNPNHWFGQGKKRFHWDGRMPQKTMGELLFSTSDESTPTTTTTHGGDSPSSWLGQLPNAHPIILPRDKGTAPPQPKIDFESIRDVLMQPRPTAQHNENLIGRPGTRVHEEPMVIDDKIQLAHMALEHRAAGVEPIIAMEEGVIPDGPPHPKGNPKLVNAFQRPTMRTRNMPYLKAWAKHSQAKDARLRVLRANRPAWREYREPPTQTAREELNEIIDDHDFQRRRRYGPTRQRSSVPPSIQYPKPLQIRKFILTH